MEEKEMTKKKVERRICDVENCENEAVYICAKCKRDICDIGHSHSHGDGGHIEHSVRVTTISMEYQGEHEFFLCPQCFIDTGLYQLERECGKHVEGTGGYHSGETTG